MGEGSSKKRATSAAACEGAKRPTGAERRPSAQCCCRGAVAGRLASQNSRRSEHGAGCTGGSRLQHGTARQCREEE